MGERVHRSVMNIKVGMLFYILSLFLNFFSRRIFLSCLGDEFIGLIGMLNNILSFLSVAELGIGISIVYFLYKPLQEDDHEKINEIMSILALLYRYIGYIIGIIGIIISFFFPWWFPNLSIRLPFIYFSFYTFLASSIIGYIFNYRQLLLSANQKQYVVNAYFQTIGITSNLIQIALALYYPNLYLWIAIGFISTIIGCIILNRQIHKEYPWLRIDLKKGKKDLRKYPEILKKTKQIFILKIKDFILNRSDEILVAWADSVVKVAFYGNYTMIINKLIYLVNILADGMSAGIGNLLAEGNDKNIMKVYWEMTATRFFIMGIVIYPLIMFIQPTITCWVGPKYQLSSIIAYLLIFNLFLRLQYATVYMFVGAYGLYSDVWTSWVEFLVNVIVTLSLAPFFGIIGILLGKILSIFFFNVFWKPYYLFSKGFHKSVWDYWRPMTLYYGIFGFYSVCAILLKIYLIDRHVDSWGSLIEYGLMTVPPILFLYFLTLFITTNGMKYFIARKPNVYQLLYKITFQS